MKKLLLLCLVALALVGCKDKNGISYADYPIAGKAYKHVSSTEGDYSVYVFEKNGKAQMDYYHSDGELDFSMSKRYWWMEKDSVFIAYQKGERAEHRGKYCGNYIEFFPRDTFRLEPSYSRK